MRLGALILSAGILLPGCGSDLPDPVVRSIAPSSYEEGDAPILRVDFDAIRPTWLNFGRETAGMNTAIEIRIGDQPFFSSDAFDGNLVTALAPLGLKSGTWDVSISLADGRQGTLLNGLTVKPRLFPAGYTIDPISDQVRGRPFQITIHAEGGNGAAYTGTVRMSVNKGTISPEVSGPFFAGTRVEWVTMNSAGKGAVITIEDAAGNQASSNPFEITP